MEFTELLSNKFVRITLMIFFFLFVYNILFAIGIFFAVDSVIMSMYLCWIGMIILFGSLLQVNRTNFNVTPPANPLENVVKQATEAAGEVAEAAKKAAATAQDAAQGAAKATIVPGADLPAAKVNS
jgi:hypothetical protein